MLEGIALSVIGGAAYLLHKHLTETTEELQPVRYMSLTVVAGIIAFAALGEPTSATAWQFMAAGFSAPAFVKDILVPWWKAD